MPKNSTEFFWNGKMLAVAQDVKSNNIFRAADEKESPLKRRINYK